MSRRKRRCFDLGDGVTACGPRPPSAADLAIIEKFKKHLRGEGTLREKREFAGLTLGQAAKLSGLSREAIEAAETGTTALDEFSLRRLTRLYEP